MKRHGRFLSMEEDLAGASQVMVGEASLATDLVGASALGDLASARGVGAGAGVVLGFNQKVKDRERKEPGYLGTGLFSSHKIWS